MSVLRNYVRLVESETDDWPIDLPALYYRGSAVGMRSAYLTKLWRQPSDDLPDDINHLLTSGRITRVSGLSMQTPFRISRSYAGMSNWGFGVYFASDLDWVLRYGTSISVVQVDPAEVLAIRDMDFANERAGTAGGDLRRRLRIKVPDHGMAGEARIMGQVVRSMQRGAKALYVSVSRSRGQLCVFGTGAIIPKYYFEVT